MFLLRYAVLVAMLSSGACESNAVNASGGASTTSPDNPNPNGSSGAPGKPSGEAGSRPFDADSSASGSSGGNSGSLPSGNALDDEFDGAAIAPAWTVLNQGQFKATVGGGILRMTPTKNCVWYQTDEGPALIKLVTGDFKVTTNVRARRASHPTEPPPREFQFAGLIARDAASHTAPENYVFTVMGERGGWLTNETKTTVNGSSTVHGPNEGRTSADAQLRICRVGQVFRMYNRPPGGGTWKLESTYDRASAPLPATLEVGPIAYAYTNSPDLVGEFDYVRFATVVNATDCTTD